MPTLNWIGKEKVINHHQDVPYKTLEPQYTFTNGKESKTDNSQNKVIHGDNLEALKSLLPEYESKVKCIYIDPPYNTGNEGWVYNDNVSDPKLKKWLGQVVGKESEDLSRHDKWLCMMYPRLKLLHKLLAHDGAIFISIDDNEQANLRLICDEIFGSRNFTNNIIWEKKYSPQNDAKYYSDNHDFILCYAKNKSEWQRKLLPRTDAQNKRYKNPDNDKRGVWKSSDLSVKTYSESTDYEIEAPSGRIVKPPNGRCWGVSKVRLDELIIDNRIWFGKKGDGIPRLKTFMSEVQSGLRPNSIWFHDEVGHNQEGKQQVKSLFEGKGYFDGPKPVRLLNQIIKISSSEKDDIILDFFSGSATTAHSVFESNLDDNGKRKFIMVQLPETLDENSEAKT